MSYGLEPERVYFAGTLEGPIGELLGAATQAWSETETAEAYLLEAQRQAPTALPVYFSLYKFYFYKGELESAEKTVCKALETAALLGGFAVDWRAHTVDSAPWSQHDSPAHFYLFSLKALAFIRLRRSDQTTCSAILSKLVELDPADTVGSGVIAAMAEGVSH